MLRPRARRADAHGARPLAPRSALGLGDLPRANHCPGAPGDRRDRPWPAATPPPPTPARCCASRAARGLERAGGSTAPGDAIRVGRRCRQLSQRHGRGRSWTVRGRSGNLLGGRSRRRCASSTTRAAVNTARASPTTVVVPVRGFRGHTLLRVLPDDMLRPIPYAEYDPLRRIA